ncbi:hypothetical protein NB647_04115 [Oxalobacter aliiformigenes]|uniref:hypothetical protein n=1 Tax=Oxalobacter aliiformigenes TaxID=2946593 RepID=UPI0022AEE4E5|nr:hypothetical protein [Oxalobacter aliiformigenes]WAV89984.1 hypothetical protein NB647_04115 [Oxalobacter aliiformigenes]
MPAYPCPSAILVWRIRPAEMPGLWLYTAPFRSVSRKVLPEDRAISERSWLSRKRQVFLYPEPGAGQTWLKDGGFEV